MKKETKKILVFGGLAAGFLLLASRAKASTPTGSSLATLSYLGQNGLPLGMRRNNPGNLVSGVGYKGEISDGGRFAAFQTWAFGIRAMIVLLRKYITVGSSYPNPCVTTPQNTVALIVAQWAPKKSCGGDNDDAVVEKYINYVATRTGFGRNQQLTANQDTLRRLVMAMAYFEQGRECVTAEQFNYAFTLV